MKNILTFAVAIAALVPALCQAEYLRTTRKGVRSNMGKYGNDVYESTSRKIRKEAEKKQEEKDNAAKKATESKVATITKLNELHNKLQSGFWKKYDDVLETKGVGEIYWEFKQNCYNFRKREDITPFDCPFTEFLGSAEFEKISDPEQKINVKTLIGQAQTYEQALAQVKELFDDIGSREFNSEARSETYERIAEKADAIEKRVIESDTRIKRIKKSKKKAEKQETPKPEASQQAPSESVPVK